MSRWNTTESVRDMKVPTNTPSTPATTPSQVIKSVCVGTGLIIWPVAGKLHPRTEAGPTTSLLNYAVESPQSVKAVAMKTDCSKSQTSAHSTRPRGCWGPRRGFFFCISCYVQSHTDCGAWEGLMWARSVERRGEGVDFVAFLT